MNAENIARFKDQYFDRIRHIFLYISSKLTPTYICLDEIVVLGSLETTPSEWVGSRQYATEQILYVDMFMKSGGLYKHIIKRQRGLDITENDRDLYEAFRQCWLECRTPILTITKPV